MVKGGSFHALAVVMSQKVAYYGTNPRFFIRMKN
jgi:hypothetical protein